MISPVRRCPLVRLYTDVLESLRLEDEGVLEQRQAPAGVAAWPEKKESRTVASQSSAPLAYAVRGNTSEVLCGAMLGEPGPSTRGPAAPADDANTHLFLPTPCTSAGHSTERRQQARANGRADAADRREGCRMERQKEQPSHAHSALSRAPHRDANTN